LEVSGDVPHVTRLDSLEALCEKKPRLTSQLQVRGLNKRQNRSADEEHRADYDANVGMEGLGMEQQAGDCGRV